MYPLYNALSSDAREIMANQGGTRIRKTVNLLDYAYAGSNPALPTTYILSELKTKAPPPKAGLLFSPLPFLRLPPPIFIIEGYPVKLVPIPLPDTQ